MQTEHYKRVKKFMELAKQDTPNKPILPDENTRILRAKLILEEALETIEALGFDVYSLSSPYTIYHDGYDLVPNGEPNLVEIIDGCCDTSVVTIGTLIACGVPDKPFLESIDNNNLAKFGPGHSWNEDGKLIKPPNHKPPEIKEILKEY